MTFIVMKFVEGKTVRQLIANHELDLVGSVEIALHVAEGFSKAHKANIVHRDIKSDNIMLARDGHTQLLDFDLAKAHEIRGCHLQWNRCPGGGCGSSCWFLCTGNQKDGQWRGLLSGSADEPGGSFVLLYSQ